MSKKNKVTVQIENPVAGGAPYTSVRRANDFVRRGWAVQTGPNRIRFIEGEERSIAQARGIERRHVIGADRPLIEPFFYSAKVAGRKIFALKRFDPNTRRYVPWNGRERFSGHAADPQALDVGKRSGIRPPVRLIPTEE